MKMTFYCILKRDKIEIMYKIQNFFLCDKIQNLGE